MDWVETPPARPPLSIAYFAAGSTVVWTDAPAGEARLLGTAVTNYGMLVDLRPFRQARVTWSVAAAGLAGTVLRFKYSVTPYSSEAVFSPDMAIDAPGDFATAWFAIPAAAKADLVRFAMFSQGGNGAADPGIRGAYLQLR